MTVVTYQWDNNLWCNSPAEEYIMALNPSFITLNKSNRIVYGTPFRMRVNIRQKMWS